MKKITFSVSRKLQQGANPEHLLLQQSCVCSEEALNRNLAIVQKIAYNGEYTIEDDSTVETIQPTQEQRLAAVEAAVQNIPDLIRAAVKAAFGTKS